MASNIFSLSKSKPVAMAITSLFRRFLSSPISTKSPVSGRLRAPRPLSSSSKYVAGFHPAIGSFAAYTVVIGPYYDTEGTLKTITLTYPESERFIIYMRHYQFCHLTRDQLIELYIETLARVVGSEEEARSRIFAISTTEDSHGFWARVSHEQSEKIKRLPGVATVLPAAYKRGDYYGGEPFGDWKEMHDPKYYDDWLKNPADPKFYRPLSYEMISTSKDGRIGRAFSFPSFEYEGDQEKHFRVPREAQLPPPNRSLKCDVSSEESLPQPVSSDPGVLQSNMGGRAEPLPTTHMEKGPTADTPGSQIELFELRRQLAVQEECIRSIRAEIQALKDCNQQMKQQMC